LRIGAAADAAVGPKANRPAPAAAPNVAAFGKYQGVFAMTSLRLARIRLAAPVATAIALAAAAPPARAEAPSFTVAPYVWITSVSASLSIGETSTSINKSFIDILKSTEKAFAFSGYGAVHHGNFTFFVEGLYSRLKAETNAGFVPVTAISETDLVDFGLSYRFDIAGEPGSGGFSLAVDPYLAGRYVGLYTRITSRGRFAANGQPLIDVQRSWTGVDPVFGVRFTAELDRRWRLTVAGDVGGGAAQSITWSASGLVGYRFEIAGIYQTAWLGYKALSIDLNAGSQGLRIRQVLHGPVFGASFRF
jgi:hypothetical protein